VTIVATRTDEIICRLTVKMGMSALGSITSCPCCGSTDLAQQPVLWPALIAEWRLDPSEVAYIERQQGWHCRTCGTTLRGMALAVAVMRSFGYKGRLAEFVTEPVAQRLCILEINEADHLTPFFARISGHVLGRYPEIDIQALPFADRSFDLVVHSDTLEHVPDPVRGLAECYRVLVPGGVCAFTVPVVIDRMTVSRAGMPPSYHGSPGEWREDYVVYTEYGCDIWTQVVQAGFPECRIHTLEHPAAHAFVAVREP
jgi:SAM-dependent methyltransferase